MIDVIEDDLADRMTSEINRWIILIDATGDILVDPW